MKCDRKKFIISKDIVNVTGALKYMFINLTLWFLHMVRPWVEKYGFNYISIDLEVWPKEDQFYNFSQAKFEFCYFRSSKKTEKGFRYI